jgi:tetratricopeptide (TPR) repeat protein
MYSNVSASQLEIFGKGKTDYFESLQQIVFVLFLMTNFKDAAAVQGKVSAGLQSIVGPNHSLFLQSQIFDGYIEEARDRLDAAFGLYNLVYENRSETLGKDNPLALFAQIAMASVYRKQGDYENALKHLEYAFRIRQQLWGLKTFTVVDTAIHLIVLYREMGRLDDACTQIELVSQVGIEDEQFERFCQVEHLRALVQFDGKKFKAARTTLQLLLDKQAEKGREFNNRSLLWVRLTLATILRQDGKCDEARMLFDDIVEAARDDGDLGLQYEKLQTPEELLIAEQALRLVRDRKVKCAEELLEKNGLRWKRKEDFWLFEGGPSADTAWIKEP